MPADFSLDSFGGNAYPSSVYLLPFSDEAMTHRVLKVVLSLSLITVCLFPFCGCKGPLVTAMALFKGDNPDPPEFPFLVKGEKTVAVVCRSMVANQLETQNVPRDLTRRVGELIHHKTKNKKLKVVESTKVNAWLDNCDNIFNDFLEVGRDKSIAADYVIGIELVGFQLRDPHSPHLIQGRTRLQVRLFDCESGEVVANKAVDVVFPPNLPITAGPGIDQPFRNQFIQVVSEQVAILFVHHDKHKSKTMDADVLDLSVR